MTPLQQKTPFGIDPEPASGLFTPHAGLSLVSRALRSLGLPRFADARVPVKKRQRGLTAGQQLEALILLHAAGGDCMDDMALLRNDPGIEKMLGYTAPSPTCVRTFLEAFHDPDAIARARDAAAAQERLAFIPEENGALAGLGQVQGELVRAIAATLPEAPPRATVDQDATIIESHKRDATCAYDGTKGYQPMVAVWAETRLVLADEFRDGNVPALMAPLTCAQAAFAALPETVEERCFRGDSACYEHALMTWLAHEARPDGPSGFIGFAISARMSAGLGHAIKAVPETAWTTFANETDGTLRQWAEVAYVPDAPVEKKDLQPLRYVGLCVRKPQGELFADGNDRHYHAVVTNRWDLDGGALIAWHREKQGTVEHVHDELKNGLGAGQLPSGKFGANAAWFRIACLAHNVLSALRLLSPDPAWKTAQAKRLRFALFAVTGRFSRDRRKITLHLSAPKAWIACLIRFFELFPLRTQPTG